MTRYVLPSARRVRATRRAIFWKKVLEVLGTIFLGLLLCSPMIYDALCRRGMWSC